MNKDASQTLTVTNVQGYEGVIVSGGSSLIKTSDYEEV